MILDIFSLKKAYNPLPVKLGSILEFKEPTNAKDIWKKPHIMWILS